MKLRFASANVLRLPVAILAMVLAVVLPVQGGICSVTQDCSGGRPPCERSGAERSLDVSAPSFSFKHLSFSAALRSAALLALMAWQEDVPPAEGEVDPLPPTEPEAPAGEEDDPAAAEGDEAAEPVEMDPLEKRIVFSFSKAPWDVALTRFAELADLQLILKFKPPGTFDYSSSKSFTIPEALDILNEVLIAEGFVVLRTDRFLTLAPLDQPLPLNQVPIVTTEDLVDRGRNEFVTVVKRLEYADPEGIEGELRKLLGQFGQLETVPSLKLVRLTDQVARLVNSLPLLDEIDQAAKPAAKQKQPDPPPKVRKTYSLKHLAPEKTTSLVSAVLGISGTMETGPDGASLIAVLTESEHARLAEFLAEIDIETSRDDQPAERSFTLKSARIDGVVEVLRSLYPEDESGVSIGGDAASRLLGVKGPGRIVGQIATLISAMEEQAQQNAPTQEVYRLMGDATAVAKQLQVAFSGEGASVVAGADGRSVLVLASPPLQERIRAAVAKLSEGELVGGADQTIVIKLEHASAERLATTLAAVFANAAPAISFSSDDAANALVVRAPADRLERIQTIVKDLDLPPTVMGLREKQEELYEPKHAKPSELVSSAEALYPTSTNVVFVPTAGKKIVISAPPILMEKVKQTLDLLDRAAETVTEPIDRAYTLRHAEPDAIVATLQTLFAEQSDLRVLADASNRRVFVMTDDEKLHARIAELINQLDVPSATTDVVEIYAAQNVRAPLLIESLTRVFGSDAGAPVFQLQRDGKSILIRAPKSLQDRITSLLAKIDVASDEPTTERVDELYKLKFAQAAELVTALEKLYPPDRSNVTISAEPTNNILVISAPPEEQARIKNLIQQVDVPSESRFNLRIYAPERVTPSSLSSLVSGLQYPGVGSMIVSPDGRFLLVAASAEAHKRIGQLVELIHAQETEAEPIRKTYPLKNAVASSVASMVQRLFPASGRLPVTAVADPSGKMVVVKASPKMQEAITQIIAEADDAALLEEFSILAKHATVSSLYTQIVGLFSGVNGTRVTYDVGSSTVGVVATPEMKERILAFAEKFDQPVDPATGQQRRIYKIENSVALYVYTALRALFPSSTTSVTLTYDSYNNVVVATATATQHEHIAEEVKRLDIDPRADWITKSFVTEHTAATDLLTFLTTQLASVTDKTISLGAHGNEVVANAKPSVMAEIERLADVFDVPPPEESNLVRRIYRPTFANVSYLQNNLRAAFPTALQVTVSSDPYSGTVTVVAPRERQEEIAQTVAELDQDPRKDWIEKTFQPTHITVTQLSQFLTTALSQESNKSITASPGNQMVVAVAPPPVMERIDRLVTTMDTPPAEGGEEVPKAYLLKHANPASVYTVVTQLFPPSTTGVRSYYDSRTSTVTVIASGPVQEQVASLVESMDVDPNANRVQRIITATNAPAPELVTLLQTTLASERSVSIALGPQKQSIVVVAPTESIDRIAKYIESLDTPGASETSRELYKLTFGSASYLVSTLQALYPPAQFPVTVTADAGNNVLVVEAPKLIQEKVAGLVRELDVPAGGRTQKVYSLEHTRASSLLTSVQSLLSGTTALAVAGPDDRSLVVNALPAQHEQVTDFLASFDQEANAQDPQSKVYKLRFADAANLARMVSQLFGNEPGVRVTYDAEGNTLFVTAPPLVLTQIEQVVNDADQKGIESQLVSEIIRVRDASANDVGRALRAAFPNPRDATFVADSDSGTVFVRARPDLLDDIKQTAAGLDQPKEKSRRDIAVFDLFSVDPYDAQDVVEELFDDLRSDDRPQIESTFEPARLIVRASETQMAEIREVLVKLEGTNLDEVGVAQEPGAAQGIADKPLKRVLRLNNADPVATVNAIEQAWSLLRRNRLVVIRRQSPIDALNAPQPEDAGDPADALEDPPAGAESLPGDPDIPVTIIVGNDRLTASSRDREALDLMESLADAWTQPFDPDTSASRVFYIENGDVEEMAEAIDEAFNGKEQGNGRSRRFFRPERVRVVAEPNANALIVRASPVDLINVKELIDSLDLLPTSDKNTRIIPLQQAEAEEVVAVIEEVFEDYLAAGSGPPLNVPGVRSSRTRSRTAAMSVDVDPRSNSIVVSAPETVLADVEDLVKGLEEAAADAKKSYRVIPIENASPADVRGALEILLDRQLERSSNSRSSGSRRPSRSRSSRSRSSSAVEPAKRVDQGLVNASEATETQVATIRMASGWRSAEEPKLRPVAADEKDNEDFPLVQAAFQEPAADEAASVDAISGTVEISVLDDVGALLLLGTERDLRILGEIVAEIERINQIRELSFELFPLSHTKAASMAELLEDVTERLQDARGLATRAQLQTAIIPLAKPNALLLVAPKDELAALVDLAERFDVATDAKTEFRLFRLKHIRADILSQTIENFYQNRDADGELAAQVVVEPDDRSNALVVYASPRDLEEVAQLIRELDTAKTSRVNEIRIFYLKQTVATELATTLRETLLASQGSASPANNARSLPGLEIPDVSNPDKLIGSGILEGVTITPNRRANALIVSAPKDVLELIGSLVERLDVLPEAVAEIKVFTLINSDAATLALTLRNLFVQTDSDSSRVSITPDPSGSSEGSPLIELSFSVDERTNSILVSGSREQLEVVEAIILRLDGSDIEERRAEVYRLQNAPAVDVADSLTELLVRQQQLQGVQEGQSLQQQLEQEVIVVPEPISNALLISASPRYFDQVIELIERLDELPPQVVIQVLIVAVDLDGDAEFGVELGLQDGLLFQRSNQNAQGVGLNEPFFNDGSTPGFNFNSGGPLGDNIFAPRTDRIAPQGLSNFALGRTNNALGFGGLVLSASSESVSILVRALARERRLEVLSRPQIMTLDNQTASIVVGAEVPRITGSNFVQGAGVTQDVEYVPSGIILEVTPKINPDGTVIMQVSPEISQLAPADDVDASVEIAPGVIARALDITRAVTTVSAMNGQTVMIGGLIRDSTEREERKVPCLGDIPIAGHLFRYDRLQTRRTEVMIILTPHVVRSRAEAERIKAVEAARMHWCLSKVEEVHGDIGLPAEVYMGHSPDELMYDETILHEEVIMENGETPIFPEEVVPSEGEGTPTPPQPMPPDELQEPGFVPSLPRAESVPENAAPFLHRVEKPQAPQAEPEKQVRALSRRAQARKDRAERDKKIYPTPSESRARDFKAWKERYLPWKKRKASAEPTDDS